MPATEPPPAPHPELRRYFGQRLRDQQRARVPFDEALARATEDALAVLHPTLGLDAPHTLAEAGELFDRIPRRRATPAGPQPGPDAAAQPDAPS